MNDIQSIFHDLTERMQYSVFPFCYQMLAFASIILMSIKPTSLNRYSVVVSPPSSFTKTIYASQLQAFAQFSGQIIEQVQKLNSYELI